MFTYHWGSIEVKKHAFQGDFSDIETFTPLANLYYRSLLPILGKITVFPGDNADIRPLEYTILALVCVIVHNSVYFGPKITYFNSQSKTKNFLFACLQYQMQ